MTKHLRNFETQKALPKNVVAKLKPGTWIETKWTDVANMTLLLVEKPDCIEKGWKTFSLYGFNPKTNQLDRCESDQVVKVLGRLALPK